MTEARAALSRFHAPGWIVTVEKTCGRDAVHVRQFVDDAVRDGEVWLHDEWFWLHRAVDVDDLYRLVVQAIQFRTVHELLHHVTVDGEAIFDQHRDEESIARTRQIIAREGALL